MLIRGNALAIPLKDQSVDAIITDPPYGLTFMGKNWDRGVPGVDFWTEALRVCKPGAYLLAFGGTRTFHRLTCAIEDAGFEIRDCMMWLYGSGFPKSMDVSKAIDRAAGAEREKVPVGNPVKRMIPGADQNATGSWIKDDGREYQPGVELAATDAAKQWQGWGTALKPAWEPIIVARKPIDGTVAQNVQRYGTGAMNIDACRIATDGRPLLEIDPKPEANGVVYAGRREAGHGFDGGSRAIGKTNTGRWPANLILDEEAATMLDEQSGDCGQAGDLTGDEPSTPAKNVYGEYGRHAFAKRNDSGGASRFFYVAKASRSDRDHGNTHPTVKPQTLIKYLLQLVTCGGAVVLDPFSGSGTTVKVAQDLGRIGIGLELKDEYLAMARKRTAQGGLRLEPRTAGTRLALERLEPLEQERSD